MEPAMRTPVLLVAITLLAAAEPLVADQRAVVAAASLPAQALALVQARSHVVMHPPGRSVLVSGLRELERRDARLALVAGKAPGLVLRQASTGVRADLLVRDFAKSLQRATADDATVHLAPSALPDNSRIEQPYRQYTAGMELNVSGANLAGVFRENIQGVQVIQGNGATAFRGPFTYPLELPNVQVGQLRTQAAVRAGIGPDDTGWQVDQDPRSPRDVRRAWDDYRRGLDGVAVASTRVVWTTMPLAKDGNIQRNLFNQWVRDHCAKHRLPLLDIAAIQAHDAAGATAYDSQGHRLSDAWRSTETGREQMTPDGEVRLAQAWWWLQARMAGWQPDSAENDRLDLSGS
jgi:hypothetical protein